MEKEEKTEKVDWDGQVVDDLAHLTLIEVNGPQVVGNRDLGSYIGPSQGELDAALG